MKRISAGLRGEARLFCASRTVVEPSVLSMTSVVTGNLDTDRDALRELGLQRGRLFCSLLSSILS